MDFGTKQELIDFVREQFGVVLENDETHPLNQHPDLLYTFIPKKSKKFHPLFLLQEKDKNE